MSPEPKNKKFIVLALSVLLIGLTTWYFWSNPEPLVVQQVEKKAEKVADVKPSFAEKLNRLEKQASEKEKEIVTQVLEKIVQSNKKLSTISKVQQAQNMPIEFYSTLHDCRL